MMDKKIVLASAQTNPKRGDIESNLTDHYKLIELASQNQVDLIVFPEMSITEYERDKASGLAFTEHDSRLEVLRKLSLDKQMIIVAGAPFVKNDDLFIGAFILKPDDSISIYTKQFLHASEEAYFKSSIDHNPSIVLNHEQISFSICADIDHPSHVANAHKKGVSIYIASLFFTPGGIPNAYKTLSDYAKKYSMNILMSNYCGKSWELDAGGQSGFWDQNGKLIANLNNSDSGLLIVENIDNSWIGKVLFYK